MTVKILSKELLAVEKPQIAFKKNTRLSEHMRVSSFDPKTRRMVWEFIGTDDFGAAWNLRQRYEVDAGRDMEPILYRPFYAESVDPNFPKSVSINMMGPVGVVWNQQYEGGEVKMASIGGSTQAIDILDWTVGLEYSLQLVEYNMTWDVANFERQAGISHNALLNNIHLAPIIAYSYAAANQTAASAIGATLAEKYLRTLEDAITNAKTDTANPRRGPYWLLVSASNLFTVERALSGRGPADADMQSSALAAIQGVVAYDGWSGTMANEVTTYDGVSANKAYLVDVGYKQRYMRSFIKKLMDRLEGSEDVSRLLAAQIVMWSALGIYASPIATVEEVTLPTS